MKAFCRALLGIVCASAALAGDPPKTGPVIGCEHFAFLRPNMAGGLGGPALEALKSWDGEMGGALTPEGDHLQIDPGNSTIFRIRAGQARILAGDGTRGWRDGPADQARFDFGCGSYSDASIACDASGAIYVSEALCGRFRKVQRQPDGSWQVSTVSGGGSRMPARGQSIPSREMKEGSASRFAVTPAGALYYAASGGIYEIKDGQGTCLADVAQLRRDLGEKAALADWHVGGSHITPEGVFYWMPGGGPNIYRFDTRTGKAERFAGTGKTEQYLDGPTPTQSGFHTVLLVFNRDASVMYTCGGDESIPRRIAAGRVTSLHLDGTFRPADKGLTWKTDRRWKQMSAVQALDGEGRLYLFTGDYGWGGWIVRFTFGQEN